MKSSNCFVLLRLTPVTPPLLPKLKVT